MSVSCCVVVVIVPDVKLDGEKRTGKRTGSKFEVRRAKVSHAARESRLLGMVRCLQALSQKVRLRLIAKSRGQVPVSARATFTRSQ